MSSIAAAIIAKDMRELRRDRRIVVIAVLVLALGLTALVTAFALAAGGGASVYYSDAVVARVLEIIRAKQ